MSRNVSAIGEIPFSMCILYYTNNFGANPQKQANFNRGLLPRFKSGYYNTDQKFVRFQKSVPLYPSGNRTLCLYFLSEGFSHSLDIITFGCVALHFF